jgi:inosine/xanthosine triphosphatase
MKIAIGSKNKAKITAVTTAFKRLLRAFPLCQFENVEFIPLSTQTTIPDMPLSQEQMIEGAIQRAHFAFKQVAGLDFALGLEGGTFPVLSPGLNGEVQTFLQNWVFAFDGQRGFLGSSPALPLPASIVNALYREGRELAEVIDAFSGKEDVRSNEGAFGILTRQLLTRSASFELAVINAMVPFFNKAYR